MQNLTSKQSDRLATKKRRIFAILRDTGITKEQLDDQLPVWCGRNSLREINEKEADLIISLLGKINTEPKIQPKQFGRIKGLQTRLGWDEKSLNGFISHTIPGKNKIGSLTLKEASMLIIGLQKLKPKEGKK